jgi:hypothetical protein
MSSLSRDNPDYKHPEQRLKFIWARSHIPKQDENRERCRAWRINRHFGILCQIVKFLNSAISTFYIFSWLPGCILGYIAV